MTSYDDIFAGGDILDLKEEKQVAKALGHVQILAANILASISNKSLKAYKGSTEMILITNGKVSCYGSSGYSVSSSDEAFPGWRSRVSWSLVGACIWGLVRADVKVERPLGPDGEKGCWILGVHFLGFDVMGF